MPLESRALMPTRVAFAGAAALSACASLRRRLPSSKPGSDPDPPIRTTGAGLGVCRVPATGARPSSDQSAKRGHGRKSERVHHDSDARPLRRYCDARAHMQMGEPIGGLGNAGRGAS